jgi:hypothetical protein
MHASLRFGAILAAAAIGLARPAAAQVQYWCEPLRGYYPQVASCPAPWRTVGAAPQVPAYYQRDIRGNSNYAPYDNYNHGSGP